METHGFLDDLIGQQLYINFLLFIIVVSLIVLFIGYIFLNIFIQNKDYIVNKFNNRFIRLYIRYQFIQARIASIYLPVLILAGLLQLMVAIYYNITHPIPYENLHIDLHTYV